MQSRQTRIRSKDGHLVYVRLWLPDTNEMRPLQGVLHISHGMAEHGERYAPLASYLVAEGYAVVAHDHRGHGKSIHLGSAGHYADEDGWQRVVSDMDLVDRYIQREFGDLPLFLFGHSMGSFILMQYLMSHQPRIAGVILSGSNFAPAVKYLVAQRIAKVERIRQGKLGKSPILRQLSFGSFNDRFKPNSTDYDWLSRDPAEVRKYIDDPLCGFDCSNQLWVDLLGGLHTISQDRNLRQIQADLPIYLFGGSEDPVGQQGKGLAKLADKLRQTGHSNVELKLYPQGRHEMLNETNREEVFRDLLHWIDKQDKVLQVSAEVRSA